MPVGAANVGKQHQAATTKASTPAAVVALVWDPPSVPRAGREAPDPCHKCDGPINIDRRGITWWCPDCDQFRTPPGVLAPYQRVPESATTGTATQVRSHARSQRERDLDALQLAARKGIMADQLEAIADDDRLTPQSRAVVEWFADEVKEATTGHRLDELAALYKDADVRRRYFWQGKPPGITAGYVEDDDDWDDEDQADDGAPGTEVVFATPASIAAQQHWAQPQRMTWAEALASLGWRIMPVSSWSGCQVVYASGHMCGHPEAPRHIGSDTLTGWACEMHYFQLTQVIVQANRARGFQ